MKKEPNQALEPTTTAVTIRACARLAPAVVVAHLKRSAKMKTADYASGIRGFRFLPGDPGYQYQTTPDFSRESAVQLLEALPAGCQVSFFDPEEKKEEAWIFVRRVGGTFQIMRARRGFSKWKDESLERVLTLFMSSPLVKKPRDDFDSFRVDLIDDQR